MQRQALSTRDDFEHWLFVMDDALDAFFQQFNKPEQIRLDFSLESLERVEAWLLEHYADTKVMLAESESEKVDGVARYIGETFRKNIGGHWDIRLDDPKFAFFGLPILVDFTKKATPICPHALATTVADRRTGKFLRTILENQIRRIGKK